MLLLTVFLWVPQSPWMTWGWWDHGFCTQTSTQKCQYSETADHGECLLLLYDIMLWPLQQIHRSGMHAGKPLPLSIQCNSLNLLSSLLTALTYKFRPSVKHKSTKERSIWLHTSTPGWLHSVSNFSRIVRCISAHSHFPAQSDSLPLRNQQKRSKMNSLVGQAVNVLDLLGPEQSEAIDDVEMFPPKQQQALRRVQTLYPGAAEHVADLWNQTQQTEDISLVYKAVRDVEMFPPKKQQAHGHVQTLISNLQLILETSWWSGCLQQWKMVGAGRGDWGWG